MNRGGRGRGYGGGPSARGGYSGSGSGYSGGGGRGGRGGAGRYSNPCLTMHQPWASLLVYGIKRIEGRSWPSPITGRLWIHAASKVPDQETIKAMEYFYREIYAVNGITDIKFPEHYPVSRLLGCVEVVGCLKCEELVSWEAVPESVRLEGLTDFCWLCENPQKLLIPFEMRGNQGVYNLEKRIYESAVRGLSPMRGPLPVKFPLPEPTDHFSLYPGSLSSYQSSLTGMVLKTARVSSAIAGAKAASSQYLKNNNNININNNYKTIAGPIREDSKINVGLTGEDNVGLTREGNVEPTGEDGVGLTGEDNVRPRRLQIGASNNRLFATAFGDLRLNDAPKLTE